MDIEWLRMYCLSFPCTSEGFPFDEDTLVFKVEGKMFALLSLSDRPIRINLKMDKEKITEWRERYEEVQPGYHMNKNYWNTIVVNGRISADKIKWLISHSYDEVVKKLPLNKRQMLKSKN
jgi:predicted DNA-binding protein (MmcQ/YjbR family)